MDYRDAELAKDKRALPPFTALCLSARRNMCIHERVVDQGDRDAVDTLCRDMTASWVREKAKVRAATPSSTPTALTPPLPPQEKPGSMPTCSFFEEYTEKGTDAALPNGVYSLDGLKDLGREKGWCPYVERRAAAAAATTPACSD